MIDILKTVHPSAEQWEVVMEGLRNSVDGWDKSDSKFCNHEADNGCSFAPDYFNECWLCPLEEECQPMGKLYFKLGEGDVLQMERLLESNSSRSGFRRMLPILTTIMAPLYWWKELDACTFGSVFQLLPSSPNSLGSVVAPEVERKKFVLGGLHALRQKRTVMFNYDVLASIYTGFKDHKLNEWRTFCDWIRTLPYSELITGGNDEKDILGGTDV